MGKGLAILCEVLVLKGAVQGRWQGIQGLPLQPAASHGSELMAPRQNVGGQQHSGRAELIQCSVLAGKARDVGKA